MADIICPTCGKTNPEELEICQYCGTLLKNVGTEPLAPLRPGDAPVPKKTSELERTLPTWLRDIRKGEGGQSAEPASHAEASTPTPASPPPAAPQPPKKDSSPLDLLAGLSASSEEDEEVPDWLASLKTNLPGGPVPSPEPATTGPQPGSLPPAEQSEAPADWLAGLQGDSQSEQPTIDWAAGSEQGTIDTPATPIADDTADWLSSLQAQDETAAPAAMESVPAHDLPSTGSLPDWLNALGDNSPAPAAAAEPPAPAAAEPSPLGDISQWLSGLDNEAQTPAETPATAAPAEPVPAEEAPAGNLPDWLAGLGSDMSAPAQPAPAAMETPPADLPAAFETPAPLSPPPAAQPAPSQESASTVGLPDWLAAAIDEKGADASAPDPNQSKAFSTGSLQELGTLGGTGGLPDWMAGFGANSAANEGGSSEPAPASFPPDESVFAAPPAAPAASPDADTFDWLAGAAAQGQEKPAETGTAPEAEPQVPFPGEALEQPLSFDLAAAEEQVQAPIPAAPVTPPPAPVPSAENNQNLDSILSMDMPDWLAGFTPTEAGASSGGDEKAGAAPFGADISPGNLPSWVQAMRPMEAVISGAEGGDEDQNVEKEGPLAGMRSVLPGQTGPLSPHKPVSYSIKLQVDATQQAQAALLENLIASEAESQPIVTPKRVVTIRRLRWFIAAILLLAVLVPALIPNDILANIFIVPFINLNPQVQAFRENVDSLPNAAPVLVIFDYQPGYAGEMEQAARPILKHLTTKDAHLALVSSLPMGMLMSERLIAQLPEYRINENYVELGYLPGGDAGIQVFASDPKNTLGNDNLWVSNALKDLKPGVDGKILLSNFAALVVLTDNPDTGRMWIEQTGQALQGTSTPLLMVISSQAEPMIRPYVDSKQVQGLVSGLAGGIAYRGEPNSYWSSYGVGMVATEALIVIGGIWALWEHLRARRVEQQQEEDEV